MGAPTGRLPELGVLVHSPTETTPGIDGRPISFSSPELPMPATTMTSLSIA